MVTRVLEKDGGYTSSIWLYDCRGVRQITSLAQKQTGRDTSPQWSPDGRSIAFLSGRSGKNQVWVLDLAGGEALQLTDMPKGVGDMRWSPDGTSIFLAAKEDKEEPKLREGATARRITRLRYKMNGVGYLDNLYTQLWRVDRAAGRVERLTEGPYSCGAPEPSPDGRFLAFTSARTSDETARFNDLWLLEVSTKRLRCCPALSPIWQGAVLAPTRERMAARVSRSRPTAHRCTWWVSTAAAPTSSAWTSRPASTAGFSATARWR